MKFGTGGINIDGSRIGNDVLVSKDDPNKFKNFKEQDGRTPTEHNFEPKITNGRFPANVIFDEFTGKILDEQSGISSPKQEREAIKGGSNAMFMSKEAGNNEHNKNDFGYWPEDVGGGASRFFYCPKADDFERNKGCDKLQSKEKYNDFGLKNRVEDGEVTNDRTNQQAKAAKNNHPTVKPIDLMRYLVKLIIPKGGLVIDPYCGSGTTCIGAKLELINYIGIEREEEYCKIAEARIAAWNPERYKAQTLF